MAVAGKYLSKVNDTANPEWVTFDDVKTAFMKGRTIIIVDGNVMSRVLSVNAIDRTVEVKTESISVVVPSI